MGSRRSFHIKNIVSVCDKLDRKGFVANHDGNVSVCFDGGLLATPTAEAKAEISEEMIIELDMDGKKISGIGNSFSEIKLHLAAYRSRNDAKAVVHAHPPYATARGLLGLPLVSNLPEAIVSIGDRIPVVSYAMPGAPENDDLIAKALSESDVFMMCGNGVLAIGDDLEQAYLRLELVEHIAKIDYLARTMGTPLEIPSDDRQKLVAKRESIGLGPTPEKLGGRAPAIENSSMEIDEDPLGIKNIIATELKKILEGGS